LPLRHHYGSANWIRGDPDADIPLLGERPSDPHPWSDGQLPGTLPLPLVVGSPGCITGGGSYPPEGAGRSIFGFDARCFHIAFASAPTRIEDFDLDDPATLAVLAKLLSCLYTNPAGTPVTVQLWLGSSVSVTVVPNNATLIPGSIVVEAPGFLLVVVSGTSNPQQLATQAIFSPTGPLPFGGYSTFPLWELAANRVIQRVTASVTNPTKPIVLAGHSYGGVVAALMAARYRQYLPDRPIRLVTFGMPKPGDSRLDRLLGQVTRSHLVDVGDYVPFVPPGLPDLAYQAAVIPVPLLAAWGRFDTASEHTTLSAAGELVTTQESTMLWPDVLAIVTAVLTSTPLPPVTAHSIDTYLARLRLAMPPAPLFPVPAAVIAAMAFPCPGGVVGIVTWTSPDNSITVGFPGGPNTVGVINTSHENDWLTLQRFLSSSPSVPGIVAQRLAGQTSGVQEWRDELDGTGALVDPNFYVCSGTGLVAGGLAPTLAIPLEVQTGGAPIFGIDPGGAIYTNQVVPSPTLGASTQSLPIYDLGGTLIGYLPIYPVLPPRVPIILDGFSGTDHDPIAGRTPDTLDTPGTVYDTVSASWEILSHKGHVATTTGQWDTETIDALASQATNTVTFAGGGAGYGVMVAGTNEGNGWFGAVHRLDGHPEHLRSRGRRLQLPACVSSFYSRRWPRSAHPRRARQPAGAFVRRGQRLIQHGRPSDRHGVRVDRVQRRDHGRGL
jgi:pimeloyl-ACP methyl ester carboxylesterase